MALLLWSISAPAQEIQDNLWETNGDVLCATVSGNTLYIGGFFSYVGPHTGSGVLLDAATGVPTGSFPRVQGGEIRAAAADGSGGWYIGGTFTEVGGIAREALAHVLADGSVAAWGPSPTGWVNALAISGGVVYVGGTFHSIGGESRARIAALDAVTGLATAWNPGADDAVSTLLVRGNTVYAGGDFMNIGGQIRSRIAALDATTGLATAWDPNAHNSVRALAAAGGIVYAGGLFDSVGVQARAYIAALDSATGLPTAWAPQANHEVDALLAAGSVVWAGGAFSTIGGQSRLYVAALDASTGLATAWTPGTSPGPVDVLALAGGVLYVGGGSGDVNIPSNRVFVGLNAATGVASTPIASANGSALALAASGASVLLGGKFTSYGGVQRNYIAALDRTTGQATAWNAALGSSWYGRVSSIIASGGLLYIGGYFVNGYYGQPNYRVSLAVLDTTTGALAGWNTRVGGMDPCVWAMKLAGNTLYLGGDFLRCGGQNRYDLAAIDVPTGAVLPWSPSPDIGPIYSLAVSESTVYVGGWFGALGGQPRSSIAAVHATTGAILPWDPSPAVLSPEVGISAILPWGGLVYVGGSYSAIGGQYRSGLAAIDSAGLATGWDPASDASSTNVFALAATGRTICVGGYFYTMGGESRGSLAAVDIATGIARPWAADVALSSVVIWPGIAALTISGSTMYVGGGFSRIAGQDRAYLAALNIDDLLVASVPPVTQAPGLALAGFRPNPARRDLSVAFTLPDASPAKIEMLDIAGRMLLAREVGSLGAGSHTLRLDAGRSFAPGVYLLRLTQGGRTLTARGAVIR